MLDNGIQLEDYTVSGKLITIPNFNINFYWNDTKSHLDTLTDKEFINKGGLPVFIIDFKSTLLNNNQLCFNIRQKENVNEIKILLFNQIDNIFIKTIEDLQILTHYLYKNNICDILYITNKPLKDIKFQTTDTLHNLASSYTHLILLQLDKFLFIPIL